MSEVRHVWTILCERVLVDAESGVVSVIIAEKVTLSRHLPEGETTALQVPLVLLSMWRTDELPAEPQPVRVRIVDPAGQTLDTVPATITFGDSPQNRLRVNFLSFPFVGGGRYPIVVERPIGDSWEAVAEIPIEFVNPPASEKRS